jgi:small subunit ribosomal protein S3Ae
MPPKRVGKKGKGAKKKIADAFLKKEWYVIKIPTYLPTPKDPDMKNRLGYTPAKKAGAKKQLDSRTFVVSLADLQESPRKDIYANLAHKKYKFIAEEIHGEQILTQWYGMDTTRDKRSSLIRKWRTMIECLVDCKTTDGYILRVKALAFTQRQPTQVKKNCYAKHSQVRRIRARMREIIKNHVGGGDLKSFVKKLGADEISRDIQKSCQLIFPLNPDACLIEKVKVLRKPKRDVARLMEIHNLTSTFDVPSKEEQQAEQTTQAAAATGGAAAATTTTGGGGGDEEVQDVE